MGATAQLLSSLLPREARHDDSAHAAVILLAEVLTRYIAPEGK